MPFSLPPVAETKKFPSDSKIMESDYSLYIFVYLFDNDIMHQQAQ